MILHPNATQQKPKQIPPGSTHLLEIPGIKGNVDCTKIDGK